MTKENRTGMSPIPNNLEMLFTTAQFRALSVVEQYGWKLAFVRRVMLQHAIPVIVHADGERYGVLEANGGIDLNPDIKIRM